MRLLGLAICAALAVATAFEGPAGAATHTVRVVIRPVTSTGHVRAGFAVMDEPTGSVDCSFAEASPGAVNRNIDVCSPSAEYPIACWNAALVHHVLCMRDPRIARVVRIPRLGPFAATAVAPVAERAPLMIRLADGDICSIRDGGTSAVLRSHPAWIARYYCVLGGAVWAPAAAAHNGVNESNPIWTVRTASAAGTGRIVVRAVVRAWFVGTFNG